MKRDVKEFDGLQAARYTFPSNKDQTLVGYSYTKGNSEPKGLIVMAHGLGGGGHNSYMDVADYFASNGYTVFAYDATGNDESEGKSAEGIPQGVIDLDYALRFVKTKDEFKELPIMLFGHSWGAYSVGSVLNLHKDIQAVVMVSGFNKSIDIIDEEGRRMIGDSMGLLIPYLKTVERVKFGEYATYSCVEGLENSDTRAMIIHSADDSVVSYERQYQQFYQAFSVNPRFQFVSFDDRDHDFVYYTKESVEYNDQLNEAYAQYKETLGTETNWETKCKYMEEHADVPKLFALDKTTMDEMITFFDKSISAK